MQEIERPMVSHRRGLLRAAGLGAAATATLAITGTVPARAASGPSDADILNFALNLEYLEATFYLTAVNGTGLPSGETAGTGTLGNVVGGSAVPFKTKALQEIAAGIARDELAHVEFLRGALGSAAVARPALDLYNSFNTLGEASGLHGGKFDPFADEISFLLGAYVFEDVGVTAYNGAAPLISSKTYLAAAASILAVEAYHAANIRTLLFELGLGEATNKISAVRAAASGAADDQGVVKNGIANITPTDSNALVYSRTTTQVLNIVYLGGASANYGFFPAGLNGAIA
jgi:hypothetical protein